VTIHSDEDCMGEHVDDLTNPSVCLPVRKGRSCSINSISSRCQLWTYSDELCQEKPELQLDAIFSTFGPGGGCASPGEFRSLQVICRDELPPYDY
jgi:hypothetical protein